MLNRRRFLKTSTTALAAATFAAPAFVRGQNLNSKLQMAGIGCDGKGWSDISEMANHPGVQHVAFCDIDTGRMEKVQKLAPDAPRFQDYREMFAKLGDKIDAVTVSTPDHMHAFITLDALRAGKHVYCQKPLTHNVWEARQVRLQAGKSGRITRLGNQIHSHTFYRTAVREIQNGHHRQGERGAFLVCRDRPRKIVPHLPPQTSPGRPEFRRLEPVDRRRSHAALRRAIRFIIRGAGGIGRTSATGPWATSAAIFSIQSSLPSTSPKPRPSSPPTTPA